MGKHSRPDKEQSALANKKNELGRVKNGEELCSACGKQLSLLRGYGTLQDGSLVCHDCIVQSSIPSTQISEFDLNSFKQRSESMAALRASYHATECLSSSFDVDDKHKGFRIREGALAKLYQYQDLVEFGLEEDNETISSGGVGRAVAGGVLLGPAGAIVGGVTGKKRAKNYCESMQIRISVKNADPSTVYLTFIKKKTKKNSSDYKKASASAAKCMNALEQIAKEAERMESEQQDAARAQSTQQPVQAVSAADEIRKLKELADEGIITQEEFEAKKRQLLA